MSNNKYIGYRPEINYTDNYETEKGAFQYSQETAEESTSSSYSTGSNSIEDGINKIDTLLKGVFPSKLKDSIFEVYNPIKDAYNKYLKNQSIICFNNKDKYINNTVGKVIYGLYFDRNTLSIKKGTSKKLNVYVIPTNDETNKVESWISTDPSIASVDEDGIITGLSKGNVIIRAISTYGKYDDCLVSVLDSIDEEAIINPDNSENDNVIDSDNELPEDKTDNDLNQDNNNDDFIVHVSQVSLNRTNIIIKVGQVKELIAKIYPYNSENKKLIWSSSNKKIAIVNQNGIVEGISIGECIVTVSSQDGNKTDTCRVKVVADDIIIQPNGSGSLGYGDYDSDGPIPDPPLVVVIPEVSEEPTPGIIETEFIKNLYDLIEYYINSLKDIVSKYYKTLISELPNNINIKDFSFLYNDINVSNKDIVSSYQHVLDLGLRNEKLSNLKTNFLTNSFNFNQTLYHLKNFLFTYELRKKYGNISYVKNTDISNSLSNNILKACKIDYGLKYDKAYENLYRYLNSSLKVTNNIIDDVTKGILAKGILTEKGGI